MNRIVKSISKKTVLHENDTMPLSSTITLHNHHQIPAMGLGTWKIKPHKAYDVLRLAIQIGYRHIDCAPIYGNQPEIGQAIQDAIKNKEIQREDLWITSKNFFL